MSKFIRSVRNYLNRLKPDPYDGLSTKERFESIYHSNDWKDEESVSGPGSNADQTEEVIRIVESVLQEYEITCLLDLPCGDFGWMKSVNFGDCTYIGADIVSELIQANRSRYGELQNVSFAELDLLTSDLPKVDLILVRDCLVHLSEQQIHQAIRNIQRSGIPYLLTTTFVGPRTNYDIKTGDWRPINLELSPHNWPPPIALFNEHCTEDDGVYSDKSLGLWAVDQIPNYE